MPTNTNSTSKNGDLLQSFARYCVSHPEERFWQALRNWSGYGFIFATDKVDFTGSEGAMDTFYWDATPVKPQEGMDGL